MSGSFYGCAGVSMSETMLGNVSVLQIRYKGKEVDITGECAYITLREYLSVCLFAVI